MKTIELTRGKVALVDDEDYERLNVHKWYIDYRGYVLTSAPREGGGQIRLRMHRVVMGAKPGEEVDHISGDRSDNRRANLRIATNTQNQANQRIRSGGSSKYKGVHWDKGERKWRATICRDGKRMALGRYDDERAAAIAYDKAAREHSGEFARTNFP